LDGWCQAGPGDLGDVRDDVHEIREYRNFLVHERDEQAVPASVAIEVARKRLNTLLHCLPIQW
jgi:hypothetical protein